MYLYNVTYNVEPDVVENWLKWMKSFYIPEVMKMGYFSEFKIFKLLNEVPDSTGVTYTIQYFTQSIDHVESYLEKHAGKMVELHNSKYKDKHVSFRTLLQEID